MKSKQYAKLKALVYEGLEPYIDLNYVKSRKVSGYITYWQVISRIFSRWSYHSGAIIYTFSPQSF